ncbi:bifunctional OST-HTH-LOTUS domain/OST-HTH associated domain/LOTUS-like domain [Babesia duncani]|uniref:Bifunctional OST-HTH-LOTUS domain/OST-HTH associated domain/LOTUS-like domain n=1 Tax=Babesia duncani TaxID=323732 RepID=A0AAD9PJB7_9APIC|nr:bifunctional OST-HTH-LOTUS domain/OST-HTH associated domain/LOTUS-like domain [Babesia duncani]
MKTRSYGPSRPNVNKDYRLNKNRKTIVYHTRGTHLEHSSTIATSATILDFILGTSKESTGSYKSSRESTKHIQQWSNLSHPGDKGNDADNFWRRFANFELRMQRGQTQHSDKSNSGLWNNSINDEKETDVSFITETLNSFNRDDFKSMGIPESGLGDFLIPVDYAVPERRGGLTWVETKAGVSMPSVEGSWLDMMVRNLINAPHALKAFFLRLARSLHEAIIFLYKEGIKPYLGDIANQMKRAVADNFWSAAEVAFVSLQCIGVMILKLELRVRGEMGWVVYLCEEPNDFIGFVDTHNIIDPFTPVHWRALTNFAVGLMTNSNASSDSNIPTFTGGRYAFAEKLKDDVKIFKDMRLGRVVHLVQLGIYSGVLVYAQRILLPISACAKSTMEFFPKAKEYNNPICKNSKEVLRIIGLLVNNHKEGLVLAQLKQQFIQRFNKELCPMLFGYNKLQNLLLSHPFSRYYHLYVPRDSPHRTHILSKMYPIPNGSIPFEQSKLDYDASKFEAPIEEWDDCITNEYLIDDLPVEIRKVVEPFYYGNPEPRKTHYDFYSRFLSTKSRFLETNFPHYALRSLYNNNRIGHITHLPSICARKAGCGLDFKLVANIFYGT